MSILILKFKNEKQSSTPLNLEKESCPGQIKGKPFSLPTPIVYLQFRIRILENPFDRSTKKKSKKKGENQRVIMERRNMPLSDPHHSTADLLSWTEIRRPDHSSAANRSNQVRFPTINHRSSCNFGFDVCSDESKFCSDFPFPSRLMESPRPLMAVESPTRKPNRLTPSNDYSSLSCELISAFPLDLQNWNKGEIFLCSS